MRSSHKKAQKAHKGKNEGALIQIERALIQNKGARFIQGALLYCLCAFCAFLWLTLHVECLHKEGPTICELLDDL